MIDWYLFNSCSFAQIFNPTAELTISAGRPTDEANAEIQIQPLTIETKTRKCSK